MSEAVLEHHGHDGGHVPHLAGPSPWPAILASGLGIAAFGFATSFGAAKFGSMLMGIGLAIATGGSVLWWTTMIRELRHTATAVADVANDQETKDLKMGFGLFIASEIMFFGAFFAYYFFSRAVATQWPPEGIPHLEAMLPAVNTAILVTSGFFFNFAEHSLKKGHRGGLKAGLLVAIILGATFLCGQVYEYTHMELSITKGALGTAFFMLTGFHGAHVIVGVIFLTVCFFRAIKGDFTAKRHFALQAAGWYWHFVDVVWIFLFTVLYLM